MKYELDKFGEVLVRNVRDYTIDTWYGVLSGRMNDISAQTVRAMLKDFDEQQINVLRQIIPRIIDETIFEFLFMCENRNDIHLSIDHDGRHIDISEISDGLAGELVTGEGWIARYSTFPVYDDTTDSFPEE